MVDDILSIILVEDDPAVCSEFSEIIDQNSQLSLLAITNNSDKAVALVHDCLPDVVILDIELHLGKGDGLLFLSELRKIRLSKVPYILVTTNNTSNTTYDYIRQSGADFIMSKHQEGYSTQGVVNFLVMMKDIIIDKRRARNSQTEYEESPDVKRKNILRRIASELDLIGISPKAKGYVYLQEAIYLVMTGEKKNLGRTIGSRHGKTAASVDRAMQNAINRTWATEDINDLLTRYTARIQSEKGVPTVTEFIFHYAHKLEIPD